MKLNQKAVVSKINDILAARNIKVKLAANNLKTEFKQLGVDSLNAMILITEIEKALNISLADDKLLSLKTPLDLINLILETTEIDQEAK